MQYSDDGWPVFLRVAKYADYHKAGVITKSRAGDNYLPSEPSEPNRTEPSKKETMSVGGNPPTSCNGRVLLREAEEILAFLNAKTQRRFPIRTPSGEPTRNLLTVVSRLKQGYSLAQCRGVIAVKCRLWSADPKMRPYLRPQTLFGREKFEQYVGELGSEADASEMPDKPTRETHANADLP